MLLVFDQPTACVPGPPLQNPVHVVVLLKCYWAVGCHSSRMSLCGQLDMWVVSGHYVPYDQFNRTFKVSNFSLLIMGTLDRVPISH